MKYILLPILKFTLQQIFSYISFLLQVRDRRRLAGQSADRGRETGSRDFFLGGVEFRSLFDVTESVPSRYDGSV